MDPTQRRAVPLPPRAGTRARRLPPRPQALRDDAGVGDRPDDARQRGQGGVRRRLVRDPEGRLQPHARQRPGQRPARRGVAGRGGRCGARGDRPGCRDRRRRPGRGGDRARPRRRAAHVPLSGRRRRRHALPPAGRRRHPARPDRDQDVRLAGDLRALRARLTHQIGDPARHRRIAAVPFTLRNLKEDLEDLGSRFDGAPDLEFRLATKALDLEESGLSYQRVPPGYRFPYGHTHRKQEELYVVVGGSGRMKLDDEIVEREEWDAVRVPPGTWRGYEAGPEGLEIIVIGAPNLGEAPREDVDGRRDWWADQRTGP